MGPPRSVVADVIGAGVMVWNDDPGAVAALLVDDLATGERIDPTEAGAVSQTRSIQRDSNGALLWSPSLATATTSRWGGGEHQRRASEGDFGDRSYIENM